MRGFDFDVLHEALDDTLGDELLLEKAGEDDVPAVGVFDREWIDQGELGGQVGVSSLYTIVDITLSQIGAEDWSPAAWKTYQVRHVDDDELFSVVDVRPSGRGQVRLVLNKAAP